MRDRFRVGIFVTTREKIDVAGENLSNAARFDSGSIRGGKTNEKGAMHAYDVKKCLRKIINGLRTMS